MVRGNASWILVCVCAIGFGFVGNVEAEKQVMQDLGVAIREAIHETSYKAVWKTNDGSLALAGYLGAYMAPNREQNYRIYFTQEGIHLSSRRSISPHWSFGLSSHQYGYPENLLSVDNIQPTLHGNRVEYKRNKNLIEWYHNRPEGLEQGFTLLSPPLGKGHSIHFQFTITGELNAALDSTAQAVSFTNQNGEKILRFDKLFVFDASGKILPACFSVSGDILSIEIDDTNALYPITVDPVIQSETKLTGGEYDTDAGDCFGRSVAIDNDIAVVGNPYDDDRGDGSGSAYVFVKKGVGWVQQAKLLGSNLVIHDRFGQSVSISGNTIVVGAYGDDPSGAYPGKAYIFVKNGDDWIEQAILTANDGDGNDYFGYSVAIWGDKVIIGAHKNEEYGELSGSAYIFEITLLWEQKAMMSGPQNPEPLMFLNVMEPIGFSKPRSSRTILKSMTLLGTT